nr:MAG TPA: hypothetical protein [Inoviridae sp.]
MGFRRPYILPFVNSTFTNVKVLFAKGFYLRDTP